MEKFTIIYPRPGDETIFVVTVGYSLAKIKVIHNALVSIFNKRLDPGDHDYTLLCLIQEIKEDIKRARVED